MCDLVYLATRNFTNSFHLQKIDHKYIRQLKVCQAISGSSITQELHGRIKYHLLIHISLLSKATIDPYSGQIMSAMVHITITNHKK
jgi:hypothetical protein